MDITDQVLMEQQKAQLEAQNAYPLSGPGGAAQLQAMKPSTLASRISSLSINRKLF